MAKGIFFTLAKLAKVIFALGGSQDGLGCLRHVLKKMVSFYDRTYLEPNWVSLEKCAQLKSKGVFLLNNILVSCT